MNNNNNLTNKILQDIAMSEFGKDYLKREKTKNTYKYKKVIFLTVCMIFIIIGGVCAKIFIKKCSNVEVKYPESISNAISNGYIENVDMDYIYSDGVGLKVNSYFLSDGALNFELDFKLDEDIELTTYQFTYGCISYNENYDIYQTQLFHRDLYKYYDNFLKQHNLTKEEVKNYNTNYTKVFYNTFKEGNIVVDHCYCVNKPFPKAQKLYIHVKDFGYLTEDGKFKLLSNGEWTFELDVPEKFNSSSSVEYTLAENTDEITLQRFLVTETNTMFSAFIPEINRHLEAYNIRVIDENGNKYNTIGNVNFYDSDGFADTQNANNTVNTNFSLNKAMLTDKLYLQFELNGETKTYELVKK